MTSRTWTFTGCILGVGTTSETRLVLGVWDTSPVPSDGGGHDHRPADEHQATGSKARRAVTVADGAAALRRPQS